MLEHGMMRTASASGGTSGVLDIFGDGSCKALYKFEDNVLDESGNYNGTATNVTYGVGQFGRCGVFNGSSSKLDLPTFAVNTISFWFKTSSTGFQMLYEGRKAGCAGWGVGFGNVTSQRITVTDNTGNRYTYASTLALNTWHHISVFVVAGSGVLYVNGTYIASFAISYDTSLSIHTLGNYGTSYFLNGSIDQVRIFNRALTQAEVTTLYTGEA